MKELSLEQMMEFLSNSRKGYLYTSLLVYSLILGAILFCCFLIEYFLLSDGSSIFLKYLKGSFVFVYLILVCYQLYKFKFGVKNQFPGYKFGIYIAYYQCTKCESLYGGIFGKGPLKKKIYNESCIHNWQAMYGTEFEEKIGD